MKCKILFVCLTFIFLSYNFNLAAFNPGKESQFIGYFNEDNLQGKDSLSIEDPKNSIILIYNQGWGSNTSKSKYVTGKDKCYVDYYLKNKSKEIIGNKGPWYSLASEYRSVIKEKKIYLYYFCKNTAQGNMDEDLLRSLMIKNLIKLIDKFVDLGVPRNHIFPVGHSGGATVVIEAILKNSDKINAVIATSWTVAGKKPLSSSEISKMKRFAARYKKQNFPLNAIIYACDRDEFTSYSEQNFWNDVKGVEFVKLLGNHNCWFKLFKKKQELKRIINFIESNISK